jgi:hypothetical protein
MAEEARVCTRIVQLNTVGDATRITKASLKSLAGCKNEHIIGVLPFRDLCIGTHHLPVKMETSVNYTAER